MINSYLKKNYHILTYILLYISLLIGFFLDENITGGPKVDFEFALKQVKFFEDTFEYTFFHWHILPDSTRISPLFILILYFVKQVLIDPDFVRFFLLHVLLLTQVAFYYCLKEVYLKTKIVFDKKPLILLSCIIFVSPSFRANTIWPESAIFGLLLFLIGLYYFLKNINKFSNKNIYLNIFFIALASYIRPSYCLFAIYFTFYYFFTIKNKKFIFNIILTNTILAFPAFYYIFILKIFFIGAGGLDNNYFNKIPIILSIIFFHLIPLLYYKKEIFYKIKILESKLLVSVILLLTFVFIIGFDYKLSMGGGGILLHLSHFITATNYIFFILIPLFLFFIFKVIKIKFYNNALIILILLLIAPQYNIFEKYYEPLVFILGLTILRFDIKKNFFSKPFYLIGSYSFYAMLYLINFFNQHFIYF